VTEGWVPKQTLQGPSKEVAGVRLGPVFLSYHRPDWEVVRVVADQLRARAVETFIDRENLVAGMPWPEALERAIRGASGVVAFIGPAGQSVWQRREISYALARQIAEEKVGQSFPVIPVLLPGADPSPGFLFLNQGIDLRRDQADPAAFEALVRALSGDSLAPSPALGEAVCPYRGLQRFREQDGGFFFGRDAFVDRLLERVMRDPLTVLIGASGSGKSSVVHAGLLPRLRRRRPPETTWDTVVFRPGAQPFNRLTESLISLLEPRLGRAAQLAEAQTLADNLASGRVRLDSVIRGILDESHGTYGLVLAVDQFEEVLTVSSRQTAAAFVNTLIGALVGAPLRVVLVLRADFFGHAIELSPELRDRLESALISLARMGRAELQEAIIKPAHRVGLQVEAELVPVILDDVERAPGGLPLLEHALLELWHSRRGDVLTVEAYHATGGVEGSVAQRAERTFLELTPVEQDIARRVMLRLTVPGQDTADTRRRAAFDELVTRESERDMVERVVQTFTDARLLTTTAEPVAQDRRVDVSHEALIAHWPRLHAWIEDDRAGLRIAHRLSVSAREWEQLGQDEDALYRGAVLLEVLAWADRNDASINDLERGFLAASRELYERDEAREQQDQARAQLSRFPVRRSVVLAAPIILAIAAAVTIAVELPQAVASPLRVGTLLILNVGVLITVQYWLSRTLLFSAALWYLAVYRQRRLPTLLAAILTLWYASTVGTMTAAGAELNLAAIPPDAFIQYMVVVALLTSVVALVTFVLTWQIGNLTQRRVGKFGIGFYSAYGIVLLVAALLFAGTFVGVIPKFFKML
jgi:hypothetical protein